MKSFILIITLFVFALLGAVGLFVYKSQIPDVKELNTTIQSQLSKIIEIDTNTNELALRNRVHIENNYDSITASMSDLSSNVANIANTLKGISQYSGSLLEKRFLSLQQEVMVKSGYIENFKTRFAVLRNSERYAPIVGKRIVTIAEDNELPDVAKLYRDTIISVLEYSSQTTDNEQSLLSTYIKALPETEALMPDDALIDIIEFTRHTTTVLNEISFVDLYLVQSLETNTAIKIHELDLAWSQWTKQFDQPQKTFELAMISYVIYLLILLAVTVFILRSFYSNLESTIKFKTSQLQDTYDQLHQSEGQLMQAEKLSSLGQMVAGIAHEINTPLGYLSSNISTVKRDLVSVTNLYSSVKALDQQVKTNAKDMGAISSLLKNTLIMYRKVEKHDSIEDINELLGDSSHGIDEISQLVTSLKDFSRQDKGDLSFVNIHDSIKATIKISSSLIKDRKVNLNFKESLPEIQFMPVQLNQVFLNLLTNAAHATQEDGEIEITTNKTSDHVSIAFKDNGSGMDEQTQSKIFDPFYTTKQNNEGTGLGMSITYKVIQSHNGTIEIQSELGQGSTITITLPITQDTYLDSGI